MLCCSGSLAAPPDDTGNTLFRFDKSPDVARARIGNVKLQRIFNKQQGRGGQFASVDAMVEVIARDDDLVSASRGSSWPGTGFRERQSRKVPSLLRTAVLLRAGCGLGQRDAHLPVQRSGRP